MSNFMKWMKQREIFVHPGVNVLHVTPEMGGCGVFATTSLPVGTVVLSTPAAASICPYETATSRMPSIDALEQLSSSSKFKGLKQDPVLWVVLRLMAESVKGKRSPYYPWLVLCPPMSDHLFDLSPAEMKALGVEETCGEANGSSSSSSSDGDCRPQWTGVSQQLRDLRVVARWALAKEVIQECPEVWPPTKATFALFCSCLAHVHSRNFHREDIPGREGPYLLPALDFLNHRSPPNTSFTVRGGGRKHDLVFVVTTTHVVKAGEQVFASYGGIGSARFAVEFQFISQDVLGEDLCRFSCAQLVEMATHLHMMEQQPATEAAGDETAKRKMEETWRSDMQRRVELMQRMGLLYDEGIYLLAQGISSSKEASRKAWRHFQVVCLLLLASTEEFERLYYHDVSLDWEPPASSAAAASSAKLLRLKCDSVNLMLKEAPALFNKRKEENVVEGGGEYCSPVSALLAQALEAEAALLEGYRSSSSSQ